MRRSKFTTVFALALLALAGCNPVRTEFRRKADEVNATVFNVNSSGPRAGQRVEPKYCLLSTAIISRPVGDRVVDSSLWDVADEQVIKPDLRQALEANGLRVGIITGDLPSDVLETFQAKGARQETRWVQFALPDGETTPIIIGEPVESVTLFLNHGGKVDGRDYHNALGRLLVTPRQADLHDVETRVVPQIQHGEKRRTIGAVENAGNFAPQEFAIKDAQQEEILRELGASLEVKPGQTMVIGCRSEQPRSLGTFLFLQPEAKSDRMLQSILLIQPSRNQDGSPKLKMIEDPTVEATESTATATASAAAPATDPQPAEGAGAGSTDQ